MANKNIFQKWQKAYQKHQRDERIQKNIVKWGTGALNALTGHEEPKKYNILEKVTGLADKYKAKNTKEEADSILSSVNRTDKIKRKECDQVLTRYGRIKLSTLRDCVKPFLDIVEAIGSHYKEKQYEILQKVNIDRVTIANIGKIEMSASKALETAGVATAASTIALTGVPTATTTMVALLAHASTGTAISELSGAAATNATLAWLGGGSLATGGGGMAAGDATLSTITTATTGVFALAAVAIVSKAYYSNKYTEATEYLSEVKKMEKKAQLGWDEISNIEKRAKELQNVTMHLRERMLCQLNVLNPLVAVFDANNEHHLKVFQNCALLAKAISELSQVPLLDENGKLSNDSAVTLVNTQRVLNRNL